MYTEKRQQKLNVHIAERVDVAFQQQVQGRAEAKKANNNPMVGAAPLISFRQKRGQAPIHGQTATQAYHPDIGRQYRAGQHQKGVGCDQFLQPIAP